MFKTRLDKLEKAVHARGKRPEFKRGSYLLSKENGQICVVYNGTDISDTNSAQALIAKLGPEFISKLDGYQRPVEVLAFPALLQGKQDDVLIIDDIGLRGRAI